MDADDIGHFESSLIFIKALKPTQLRLNVQNADLKSCINKLKQKKDFPLKTDSKEMFFNAQLVKFAEERLNQRKELYNSSNKTPTNNKCVNVHKSRRIPNLAPGLNNAEINPNLLAKQRTISQNKDKKKFKSLEFIWSELKL